MYAFNYLYRTIIVYMCLIYFLKLNKEKNSFKNLLTVKYNFQNTYFL